MKYDLNIIPDFLKGTYGEYKDYTKYYAKSFYFSYFALTKEKRNAAYDVVARLTRSACCTSRSCKARRSGLTVATIASAIRKVFLTALSTVATGPSVAWVAAFASLTGRKAADRAVSVKNSANDSLYVVQKVKFMFQLLNSDNFFDFIQLYGHFTYIVVS